MFSNQWHLNGGARGGFDMNVRPAWNLGYSGKGVVVTILDDGIQTNHPDLRSVCCHVYLSLDEKDKTQPFWRL